MAPKNLVKWKNFGPKKSLVKKKLRSKKNLWSKNLGKKKSLVSEKFVWRIKSNPKKGPEKSYNALTTTLSFNEVWHGRPNSCWIILLNFSQLLPAPLSSTSDQQIPHPYTIFHACPSHLKCETQQNIFLNIFASFFTGSSTCPGHQLYFTKLDKLPNKFQMY